MPFKQNSKLTIFIMNGIMLFILTDLIQHRSPVILKVKELAKFLNLCSKENLLR